MRYKLDIEGYVSSVAFGCYLDNCAEYTGTVPLGYNSLVEWSENACIQAYYIDSSGNLMLDVDRQRECREKANREAIDNAPLVRKDLYESETILDSQYIKATETGEVIVLEDIKTIAPKVKITGIEPSKYGVLKVYTQGRNMMPCTAKDETVSDVTFTKNYSGAITIEGTSTEDIEYSVSSGGSFWLKANHDYHLNLGGFECELRYFDGETSFQQYVGASGLLNLSESKKVTDVILKIPKGTTVDTTIFPQLEYGNAFTFYDPHKSKTVSIDFGELVPDSLYPSDDLYPSDTLYPDVPIYPNIEYILIQNGVVSISVDGTERTLGSGVVGLYSNYNTIYTSEDTTLEIEYSTKLYDVDSLEFLQGKATTTNQFKILKDGSIEAHNGYFSGKIEADSGYFKGEININDRFVVNEYGDVTLPPNTSISFAQVVGGKNMLLNTRKMDANWSGRATITTGQADPEGGTEATLITGTSDSDSYIAQADVFEKGGKYVVSFWAKSNGDFTLNLYCGTGKVGSVELTTEWQKYEVPFSISDTLTIKGFFFGGWKSWTDTSKLLYLYHPMLEEGTTGSNWSMASGDMVSNDTVVASINQSGESLRISASRIDLNGLVMADELLTTFATVGQLDASLARIGTIESNYVSAQFVSSYYASIGMLESQIARIDEIESNYITASTVKADYMEVTNWTSSGYIKASKINVDDLFSRSIIVNGSFGISGISSFSFENVSIEWGYINGVKCLVAAE